LLRQLPHAGEFYFSQGTRTLWQTHP
jgi:hypothetical protein